MPFLSKMPVGRRGAPHGGVLVAGPGRVPRLVPARWEEAKLEAADVREVQAVDVDSEAQQDPRAEISAGTDAPEACWGIDQVEPEAEAGIEQRSGELAGIDPEALATMTPIQGNLADAEQWAEKEARDWAAIEQAGIDEPVNHAAPQARLEAARAADLAEADQSAEYPLVPSPPANDTSP
jgi:hypothetical protein